MARLSCHAVLWHAKEITPLLKRHQVCGLLIFSVLRDPSQQPVSRGGRSRSDPLKTAFLVRERGATSESCRNLTSTWRPRRAWTPWPVGWPASGAAAATTAERAWGRTGPGGRHGDQTFKMRQQQPRRGRIHRRRRTGRRTRRRAVIVPDRGRALYIFKAPSSGGTTYNLLPVRISAATTTTTSSQFGGRIGARLHGALSRFGVIRLRVRRCAAARPKAGSPPSRPRSRPREPTRVRRGQGRAGHTHPNPNPNREPQSGQKETKQQFVFCVHIHIRAAAAARFAHRLCAQVTQDVEGWGCRWMDGTV